MTATNIRGVSFLPPQRPLSKVDGVAAHLAASKKEAGHIRRSKLVYTFNSLMSDRLTSCRSVGGVYRCVVSQDGIDEITEFNRWPDVVGEQIKPLA